MLPEALVFLHVVLPAYLCNRPVGVVGVTGEIHITLPEMLGQREVFRMGEGASCTAIYLVVAEEVSPVALRVAPVARVNEIVRVEEPDSILVRKVGVEGEHPSAVVYVVAPVPVLYDPVFLEILDDVKTECVTDPPVDNLLGRGHRDAEFQPLRLEPVCSDIRKEFDIPFRVLLRVREDERLDSHRDPVAHLGEFPDCIEPLGGCDRPRFNLPCYVIVAEGATDIEGDIGTAELIRILEEHLRVLRGNLNGVIVLMEHSEAVVGDSLVQFAHRERVCSRSYLDGHPLLESDGSRIGVVIPVVTHLFNPPFKPSRVVPFDVGLPTLLPILAPTGKSDEVAGEAEQTPIGTTPVGIKVERYRADAELRCDRRRPKVSLDALHRLQLTTTPSSL